MFEEKKPDIAVSELHYYFDAQERDTLDRQGHSHRSSEVLTIRNRLLALPERDFDSVVKTIKNMLSPGAADPAEGEGKSQRRNASELYEKVRTERPNGVLKTNPV